MRGGAGLGRHGSAGRGQMSDEFLPVHLAGATLWLRGDLGITVPSGETNWNDQAPTGGANNLENATASLRPTHLPTGGPGGLPCVDFDGSNDQLGSVGASSTMVTTTAWTTFLVARIDTITANSGSVWLNHCLWGEVEGYFGIFARSNGGTPEVYTFNYDGTADTTPHIATSLGAWIVIEARHESDVIYCRVAAGAEQSAASLATADDIAQISSLGLGLSGGAYFDGRLAEVAVYNRALAVAERNRVRAYLGGRYGLTV